MRGLCRLLPPSLAPIARRAYTLPSHARHCVFNTFLNTCAPALTLNARLGDLNMHALNGILRYVVCLLQPPFNVDMLVLSPNARTQDCRHPPQLPRLTLAPNARRWGASPHFLIIASPLNIRHPHPRSKGSLCLGSQLTCARLRSGALAGVTWPCT